MEKSITCQICGNTSTYGVNYCNGCEKVFIYENLKHQDAEVTVTTDESTMKKIDKGVGESYSQELTLFSSEQLINLRGSNVSTLMHNISFKSYNLFNYEISQQFEEGSKIIYDINDTGEILVDKELQDTKNPTQKFNSVEETNDYVKEITEKSPKLDLDEVPDVTFAVGDLKRLIQKMYTKSVKYTDANDGKYTKECVPQLSSIKINHTEPRIEILNEIRIEINNDPTNIAIYHFNGTEMDTGYFTDTSGERLRGCCFYCNKVVTMTEDQYCEQCSRIICDSCSIEKSYRYQTIHLCKSENCRHKFNDKVERKIRDKDIEFLLNLEGVDQRMDQLADYLRISNIVVIITGILLGFWVLNNGSDNSFGIIDVPWPITFTLLFLAISLYTYGSIVYLIPKIISRLEKRYRDSINELTDKEQIENYGINNEIAEEAKVVIGILK